MKKATLGVLALLIMGVVAAGAVSAFGGFGKAWENRAAIDEALEAGDYDAWKDAMVAGLTEERFEQMAERHENMPEERAQMMQHKVEMADAIEAGDFDTWKALVEDSPRTPPFELTQDNFDLVVQMHSAMQDGDQETALEIREDLGLGNGKGMGFGPGGEGRGHGMGRGGFGRGMAEGGCPCAAE